MTTGKVNIRLPGIYVDGEFNNGQLTNGVLEIANIQYEGKFNARSLLDGYGSMTIGNTCYCGKYLNGELFEGQTIVDGKITESGYYTYTGINKHPHLYNGKKYTDVYIEEGVFDNHGMLVRGEKHNDTSYFSGKFVNDSLVDGTARYTLANSEFSATYRVEYDFIYKQDIFKRCTVEYDGNLEDLSKKLLIMVCCNGKNSAAAHKFCLRYLHEFDSNSIRYLKRELFGRLSPLEEVGLCVVLENLSKYADFKHTVKPTHKPPIIRAVSSEKIS